MNNLIYRVVLKVKYYEAHFDFETAEDAAAFARVALTHMVASEDTEKQTSIMMLISDANRKESEEE